MPQDKKNGVSPEKYKNLKYSGAVAFFRSPHLSRNEECVLHSFEKPMDDEKYRQVGKAPVEWRYIKYHNQYNKYFGHLTGVVMVPRESIVPLCLGGADFDGDLVNVVYDEDVVNAVIRGNYSDEEGWKRKTPVIKIPSTDSNKKPIVGRVSYKSEVYKKMQMFKYLIDCKGAHASKKLKMLKNIIAFLIWQEEYPKIQNEVILQKIRLFGWYGENDSDGKADNWCFSKFAFTENKDGKAYPIMYRVPFADYTKMGIDPRYLKMHDMRLIDTTETEKYTETHWIIKDSGYGLELPLIVLNKK